MQRISIIGAALLLSAGAALAQPAPDGSAPPPPDGEGAGSGSAVASVSASPGAGVAGWTQINDRPLVIPKGKLDVHASIPLFASSTTDPVTMMTSTSLGEAFAVGGTFGVIDKLQVGGDYVFPLHPNGDISKGILALHGAYAALKNDKMELAVAADMSFLLFGKNTDLDLNLGAWFRYKVAPKISLFTGQPAIPFSFSGFGTFHAPPIGYQLSIGLNNSQPIVLSIPAGVGLQATPQIYAYATLDLFDIFLANGPTTVSGTTTSTKSANVIFSDFIPLGLGGFYTVNDKLDVGVQFADDLKNAGDVYVITFAGRFYVK